MTDIKVTSDYLMALLEEVAPASSDETQITPAEPLLETQKNLHVTAASKPLSSADTPAIISARDEPPTITSLNDDVLLCILERLNWRKLYSIRRTCKRFKEFISDNSTLRRELFLSSPPTSVETAILIPIPAEVIAAATRESCAPPLRTNLKLVRVPPVIDPNYRWRTFVRRDISHPFGSIQLRRQEGRTRAEGQFVTLKLRGNDFRTGDCLLRAADPLRDFWHSSQLTCPPCTQVMFIANKNFRKHENLDRGALIVKHEEGVTIGRLVDHLMKDVRFRLTSPPRLEADQLMYKYMKLPINSSRDVQPPRDKAAALGRALYYGISIQLCGCIVDGSELHSSFEAFVPPLDARLWIDD